MQAGSTATTSGTCCQEMSWWTYCRRFGTKVLRPQMVSWARKQSASPREASALESLDAHRGPRANVTQLLIQSRGTCSSTPAQSVVVEYCLRTVRRVLGPHRRICHTTFRTKRDRSDPTHTAHYISKSSAQTRQADGRYVSRLRLKGIRMRTTKTQAATGHLKVKMP